MTVNGETAKAGGPKWAAKMREEFPDSQVGQRPQVWCSDCREKSQYPSQKFCGKKAGESGAFGVDHVMAKCRDCGQKVSKAHMHLFYVGHAHLTNRLLDADPEWTWRPARDIPPEVMIAAIGSGDLDIIRAVMSAYPPKITELDIGNGRTERIMWGELVLHDDDGREIIMPGVGDAIGKAWGPNAVKEMIGDLLRNAAMREGAALKLWMKEDEERAQHERRGGNAAANPGGEPNPFHDGGPAEKPAAKPAARGRGGSAAAAKEPAAVEAGINPEAQAAADLAWQLASVPKPDGMGKLQKAHEEARKNRLLGLTCMTPWDRNLQGKTTVLKVFARARETLESDTDAG